MKKCTVCGIEKDETYFPLKSKKTPERGRISRCQDCSNEYQRNRYALVGRTSGRKKQISAKRDALREWYNEYKKTLACEVCGENLYLVLQFHHRCPETKSTEVSTMVGNGFSRDVILAEVAKCSVLCANCHIVLHHNERQKQNGPAQSVCS